MNTMNLYVYENRSMSNDFSKPLMLENLNVDNVQIHIPKEIDGTDMGTWAWWLVYQNAKREKYSIPMTLEGVTNDEEEEEYISTVGLNHGFTGKHGTVMYAIEAVQADGSGAVTHEWHTRTYKLEIVHTLQGNQTEYSETESDIISALISRVNELITSGAEIAEIAATIEAAAETAQEVIDSIPADYSELSNRVGANTIALAEKADRSTTYTKNEVDQMIEDVEVETDTTLAVSGAPADSAETGRQIGLLKADLGAINAATSEDAGKVLKVKTVTSGKVTEWEFGEAVGDISDELMSLKTIEVVTLNTWTEGKYYKTSGSTVNPSTSSDSGIRCMMVAVSEGDALTISAVGGNLARAWCFTDASYSVLSVADAGASYENAVINAPDNAAWCFINDRFSDGVCYQSSILAQRVTDTYTKVQTETFVDEAVTEVAFDVPQSIEWTDGWYINTSGSTVNFKAPVASATYRTATTPVRAGDKCVVYIQGGTAPRAWCFVDSTYTVISAASAGAVCDGLTLVVPANAAYLILNDTLMSETASYYLPTLKNSAKGIEGDLAMAGNGAALAADATAQSIRSLIFELLTSAAYVSDEDRSDIYDVLRIWSVSTPTKYGDRVYHTENLVLDGTNHVRTDLVLQNVDRDFTITATVTSGSSSAKRIFGIIGTVDNVVRGFAMNNYAVVCNGTSTNIGYNADEAAPIKVVFRHTAGSGVLKVSHMSTYSKGKYEFELTYTPNSANNFVLTLGATDDNFNKFVGTINEFSYYAVAWTDDIVDGYMRGTL